LKLVHSRRTLAALAIAAMVGGFASACGVKGPLYLPEEQEKEKEKGEDEEKTSRRQPVPEGAMHG
jgi:predicted small lipoprotein YifL